MARKRMIDPGIWTNVQVARLTVLQRLLYIGLISNADDEGRLNGDPTYIKGIIFPHDTITAGAIGDALKRIAKQSLIVHYRVGKSWYIQHPNWKQYQYIQKPQPSRLPSPYDKPTIPVRGRYDSPTIPVTERYDTTTIPKQQNGKQQNRIQRNGIEKKTTEGVVPFESLSLLVSAGVTPSRAKWFADHYPVDRIKQVIAYAKEKGENPPGMIIEALYENWSVPAPALR